jgi:predicted transcriptional regulator
MAEPTRASHSTTRRITHREFQPGSIRPRGCCQRGLGQWDREVMLVVWQHGSATVVDVSKRLNTKLAYTTVTTTLDRLFKKGLLQREKKSRALVYSAAFTHGGLEGQRAANLIRRFFPDAGERPDILMSCLIDAVSYYDSHLLEELESKIRRARERSIESGASLDKRS